MSRIAFSRSAMRGFSLIELIMTIVVVSLGAALAVYALDTSSRSVQNDQEIQVATRLAQDCVDHILMVKNTPVTGFTSFNTAGTNICSTLQPAVPTGYTRTVAIADIATDPPCITGLAAGQCREVTVTVTVPSGTYTAAPQVTVINF